MEHTLDQSITSEELVRELLGFIDRSVVRNGGSTEAKNPAHRVKFHWPPHPVSYSFHVLASDWTGSSTFRAHGETFNVLVARTPYGIFGRCEEIWLEERGETEEEMMENLAASAVPLFQRQIRINDCLEKVGRFKEHLPDLGPLELLKILYCEDRDVANDAKTEIEKRASSHLFLEPLLTILRDRKHPQRPSAQWCVLDLFEDLPSFCKTQEEENQAIEAMKGLIWDATNDYARTIYKAGVVIGGHIPYFHGGPTLIECLKAPSRIGRRAAIHGLFHVVEWIPETKEMVLAALNDQAQTDPDPILREYAASLADDIERGVTDHTPDPVFPDER